MHSQMNMTKYKKHLIDGRLALELSSYPINMSAFLALWEFSLDDAGVPYQMNPRGYHPAIIAQYALVQWNRYLETSNESNRNKFLTQAYWLVEHESCIDEDVSGWPIFFPHSKANKGPWLSAIAQGNSISVLMRAYQLTQQQAFLDVARRATRTFERDILDGGISTPMVGNGIFFEQYAVYPATHTLEGMVLALLGLYDYLKLVDDTDISMLIQCAHESLHRFLHEFDTGFWTYADLLHQQLASPIQLLLQAELLSALATIAGCEHCLRCSLNWQQYQHQPLTRLRYYIAHRKALCSRVFWKFIRARFFSVSQISYPLRVCIPICAFPVIGGTHTVLDGMTQVMAGRWQVEYLTQRVGSNGDKFTIHRFGAAKMTPWQFPMVWLYFFAGLRKLTWLLRHRKDYHIILPQDGVFTASFAAIAGKLAGARVVCMDHGNLTLLDSQMYRDERLHALSHKHWIKRVCARLLFIGYWPSLKLLARIAVRFTDHFLIPGAVGDGVEDACKQFNIPLSRITRFDSMIDVEQYGTVDNLSRANIREKNGIATDAIVVAMVCRLAPEKGLNVALESIHQALLQLSPEQAERVRIIIAGDGPLRAHLEKDIHLYGLSKSCVLWGEIAKPEVISLLSMSDIFLYTSTRGACLSMAILEAMASGCGVIASTRPLSNAHLLADGRGIAVPAEDVEQTSQALVLLLNDLELCCKMGSLARNYVAIHHSAAAFKRVLMRMTHWSSLDELLSAGTENEG